MVEFDFNKANMDECQYILGRSVKSPTYSPSDLQTIVAEILKPLKGGENN